MSRLLPPGLYGLDDLTPGDWVETGSVQVTPDMVDQFAALTGDRFAIHMTDEGARAHGFAARVAHGLLVLSLIDGLKNQSPAQFRAVASLHWDWGFRRPVLVGDTVQATLAVSQMRPTSDGQRGVLTLEVTARNQRGEVVQQGQNLLMVYRGP